MNAEHYQQLQKNAVFAELPARTLIEVSGDDRAKFLHNLSTNDIKKLVSDGAGHGCEAYFTTVQGKVLLHASLYCHADSIVIDASPGFAGAILPHLDKYLITEDVLLTDRSSEWRQIWVAGPKAESLLRELGFALSDESLSHVTVDNVSARRVPLASVDCFLLQMPSGETKDWLAKLASAGATSADAALVEVTRIEAGYPAYGQDITDENLPQEVARDEQAISFTKGCYLGQETVARIDALGHVNRHLVPLEFRDSDAVEVGSEISTLAGDESKSVGRVTSVAQTPRGHIGLGYIRRTAIEAKSSLKCGNVEVVIRSR